MATDDETTVSGNAATMDDLKKMETSLNSSIETRMNELREMIAQLMKAKDTTPSSPIIPESSSSDNKKDKEGGGEHKSETPPPKNDKDGKEEYHEVPHWYSPNPPIPHPHINHRGDPPKINASSFAQWQYLMKSHLNSSCIELWRIIEVGYKAIDPLNLTRREVVDCQLNAVALHMLQQAVGEKEMPHIQQFSTAKETWNALTDRFVGNESMKRNRYDALSNEAEGFYMRDGEDHEDMYRRLKTIATDFSSIGATHVDDAWIKRKYVNAHMPFEPTDLKSLQGRHNYHLMSSNEVMQEMSSFQVSAKLAQDSRARAIGMHKGASLALKAKVVAKVVDQEDEDESEEEVTSLQPKEYKALHKDYMALAAKTFWKNPAKAKAFVEEKTKSSGFKEGAPRVRSCFNCQDKYHFIAECPYENREDHGGKIVLKDKSKMTRKKPFFKKNTSNKKPSSRIVLVTQEEYLSNDDEEEEETTSEVAAIAIASSSPPSLFESPNENLPTQSARCLMAKGSEVSSSHSSKTMNETHDLASLREQEESIAFDLFMSNLRGESKMHFETLLSQYGEAQHLLERKGEIEREDAIEIASLTVTLEEEQELRVSLEEKLESIEESYNETISKLIKERDRAIAKCKLAKKKKGEFGVDHAKLTKSHEQLQIQLTQFDMPSTSTSSCDHANVIEENARLKDELARIKGKSPIDDLLQKQRPLNGKEGLGYVAKKKKKNKKKSKPAQAKKNAITSGDATRGETSRNNSAGSNNPHYILFEDYYGVVYATYVC